MICSDCGMFGDHKNHKKENRNGLVKILNDLLKNYDEKLKSFMDNGGCYFEESGGLCNFFVSKFL